MKYVYVIFGLLIIAIIVLLIICSTRTYGIDLSHHNHVDDWDQVTASFIYCKATEGSTIKDAKFGEYYKQAKEHRIPVGAYHFFTTSSSAKDQFENFKACVPTDCDLIPVLDIEKFTKGYKIGRDSLRASIVEWIECCEKHYKTRPIIYTSQSFYLRYLKGIDCYGYWFGDVNSVVYLPHLIHQSKICSVPGVAGEVDYNELKCDIDEIKRHEIDNEE